MLEFYQYKYDSEVWELKGMTSWETVKWEQMERLWKTAIFKRKKDKEEPWSLRRSFQTHGRTKRVMGTKTAKL